MACATYALPLSYQQVSFVSRSPTPTYTNKWKPIPGRSLPTFYGWNNPWKSPPLERLWGVGFIPSLPPIIEHPPINPGYSDDDFFTLNEATGHISPDFSNGLGKQKSDSEKIYIFVYIIMRNRPIKKFCSILHACMQHCYCSIPSTLQTVFKLGLCIVQIYNIIMRNRPSREFGSILYVCMRRCYNSVPNTL